MIGSGDMLLIGDFNVYGKEDFIDVFILNGWSDFVVDKMDG